MHRQLVLTLVLALLLVGAGFVLGQFYTVNRGVPELDSFLFRAQDDLQENQESASFSAAEPLAQEEQNRQLTVPEELEDLRLSRLVEGEEALRESLGFLGDTVAIKSITIPYYVSGQNQAILWIIETFTSDEALEMLERMDCRLRESDVFYNHQQLSFDDCAVNAIEGFNMHNYYYRRDNLVFWVSIVSEEPQEVLSKLLLHF